MEGKRILPVKENKMAASLRLLRLLKLQIRRMHLVCKTVKVQILKVRQLLEEMKDVDRKFWQIGMMFRCQNGIS